MRAAQGLEQSTGCTPPAADAPPEAPRRASPSDPIALVESCYRAVEWILASHSARGHLIPRPWIDNPNGEEEITRLEEEVMPVLASFLARIDEIDQALEAEQEALIKAIQASTSQLC